MSSLVAIVTGGGSGFGAGIAKKLASQGVIVVVADIMEENGKSIVANINKLYPQKAVFEHLNVTSNEDWVRVVHSTIKQFGVLNFVINNAGGTYQSKPVLETTQADFYKCIDLNLLSIYHSVITTIPELQKTTSAGGPAVMINIASTGGIQGRPGLTWYSASKAGCISATKSLAQEFASNQIRINCVCPVLGNTPLRAAFVGKASIEEYQKSIPLGRFAEPEDIANAVAHLCSDESAFITGVVLPVDGGRTA